MSIRVAAPLLAVLTSACQPAAPTVDIGPPPAGAAPDPVAGKSRPPRPAPSPKSCEGLHPFELQCELWGSCKPEGNLLDRECWVHAFVEVQLDKDEELPCALLNEANLVEKLAEIEAARTRQYPPTTPGLADAMQRHIAAYREEAAAARALGEAELEGADLHHVAAAKLRLRAANRAFDAAEKHVRSICR